MCVIANAVAATMATKAAREAAEHRAAQALAVPVQPAVPAAPAPAVDPVVGQQLLAAKAAVAEANKAALAAKKAEQAALTRVGEVEAELAAAKREALEQHAQCMPQIATLEALWGEENAAKLAAQAELAALKAAAPSNGLLGIIPPEMVGKFEEFRQRAETEEGSAFLAAFATGDDTAIDVVKMMVTPIVEAMVKKIPAGQIDLVGRSVDVMGKILMHALRERAEEEEKAEAEQPELGPVPDPVAPPQTAPRQNPLKKGKARQVSRHRSFDELADLVDTGELRVRAA